MLVYLTVDTMFCRNTNASYVLLESINCQRVISWSLRWSRDCVPSKRLGITCGSHEHLAVCNRRRVKACQQTEAVFAVRKIDVFSLAPPDLLGNVLSIESDQHALHTAATISVAIRRHQGPYNASARRRSSARHTTQTSP